MPTPDAETAVLRALGSPVRQRILDQLGRGPATSAMLARALGSNTGVTSYHLRELAKAGLVEPGEQRGRAQYWRVAPTDVRFRDPQDSPHPALARAAVDRRMAGLAASVEGYLGREDLDPAWREAALFSQSALLLTSEELADLTRAYLDLVGRWSETSRTRSPGDGVRAVRLALFAFPDDASDPTPQE